MAEKDKYYWLKLKRDFFKRHDIMIVESMPNGKDYVLLYLKLLLESIDHNGELRFSDTIPYNEQMIATITNTNIDTVRSAMKILIELHMIDVLEDKTIYMTDVNKMLGFETEWAKKKREYRQNINALPDNNRGQIEDITRTIEDNVRQEIEIELDKEKDIDIHKEKDIKRKIFSLPTLAEVTDYCNERNNGIDAQHFIDYYSARNWYLGKVKMKDWKAAVRTWEQRQKPEKKKRNANSKVDMDIKGSMEDSWAMIEAELKED